MKVIMVMYDSLNRNYLPNYGCTDALPNFRRLGERTVTFDNNYAGSLPCMPARRELHTGRYNFLHREWGPLEPFDDSMPELLKKAGVYTHLISDHCHYWEDGGATYHGRYNSWECVRGQEGDSWIGEVDGVDDGCYAQPPAHAGAVSKRKQDCANRRYILERGEFPQEETFRLGMDFIERNYKADSWFLQIETFDPHEPFFVPEHFVNEETRKTAQGYDWPGYGPGVEPAYQDESIINEMKEKYKALIRMCDKSLGQILDLMDKHQMWDDTMLIVNTDHGFLLGEREWWGKNIMPLYNELVRLPLFIWDPRSGCTNVHRCALTQTIDLAPTILDFFGIEIPGDMQGKPLKETIASDVKIHDYALYGNFGGHVNITDGQWAYMRGPADISNSPLNCYTLAPQNLLGRMPVEDLQKAELHGPLSFTKGCPVLKFPVKDFFNSISPKIRYGNKLWKISDDGVTQVRVDDVDHEIRMVNAMRRMMKENDAPSEQYQRIGIPKEREYSKLDHRKDQAAREELLRRRGDTGCVWSESAVWQFNTLCQMLHGEQTEEEMITRLEQIAGEYIGEQEILALAREVLPAGKYPKAMIALRKIGKVE